MLPHLVPRLHTRTPTLMPSERVRLQAPQGGWPASRQALPLSLENFIPASTAPTPPRGLWGMAVARGLLLPCLVSGCGPSPRGLLGGCRAQRLAERWQCVPEVALVASRCLAALGQRRGETIPNCTLAMTVGGQSPRCLRHDVSPVIPAGVSRRG